MASQTKSPKYTVTFELTALQLQKLRDLIEQSSISELKTKLKSAKVELIASGGTAKVSNSATNEASITASTTAAKAQSSTTKDSTVELDTRPCVSNKVIEAMKELKKDRNQHMLMWCLTEINRAGYRIDASNLNLLRSMWQQYNYSQVLVDEDCPIYSEYDYKQLILDVGGPVFKADMLKRKIVSSVNQSIFASCKWPQTVNGAIDWSQMFRLGTFDDKRQILITLRWINPVIGQQLLHEHWDRFSSTDQNILLRLLAINLSTADEAFLTQLLNTEYQVRDNVLKLLRRMPDSDYSRKCGQALKENLYYDQKRDLWLIDNFKFKEQYAALGANALSDQLEEKEQLELIYFWLQGTDWHSLLDLIEPYYSNISDIVEKQELCFNKLFDLVYLFDFTTKESISNVLIDSLARTPNNADIDSFYLFLADNHYRLNVAHVPNFNALLPHLNGIYNFEEMPSTLGRLELCFVPHEPGCKLREFVPVPDDIAQNFPEYINQLLIDYHNNYSLDRDIAKKFFNQSSNDITLERLKDLLDLAVLYMPYSMQTEFYVYDEDIIFDIADPSDFKVFDRLIQRYNKMFAKAKRYQALKRIVGTELQKTASKAATSN